MGRGGARVGGTEGSEEEEADEVKVKERKVVSTKSSSEGEDNAVIWFDCEGAANGDDGMSACVCVCSSVSAVNKKDFPLCGCQRRLHARYMYHRRQKCKLSDWYVQYARYKGRNEEGGEVKEDAEEEEQRRKQKRENTESTLLHNTHSSHSFQRAMAEPSPSHSQLSSFSRAQTILSSVFTKR